MLQKAHSFIKNTTSVGPAEAKPAPSTLLSNSRSAAFIYQKQFASAKLSHEEKSNSLQLSSIGDPLLQINQIYQLKPPPSGNLVARSSLVTAAAQGKKDLIRKVKPSYKSKSAQLTIIRQLQQTYD